LGIWIGICVVAVLVLCLLFYMWKLARENNLKEDVLYFDHFPLSFGNIKIFFISDIHKRMIDLELIDQVGRVDVVVIGGDLAEKGVSFEQIKENINRLKKIGPVYFVWGNNDYELDYHLLDATLLDLGVKILDNTAVLFESKTGDKISLLGVDYIGFERARLDFALQDSEEGTFKILVSHSPAIVPQVKEKHDISLALFGHTHGGQIRIFGFGRYQLGGFEKHGNTLTLTSNGYGTTFLPLRLGAKAETHLLTIKNSSEKKND